MRAAFKMLDKSISLFTPMFYLPRGLVIDVWSCHFSSLWPALSATSKTKFLTSMKEFICQRTYLSSPRKHKIACIHHQTANPGSELLCLFEGVREAVGFSLRMIRLGEQIHGTSTQTGKGLVLWQTPACRLISFCWVLYRGYEWLRRHISTCTMWSAQDLPVGLSFRVIPECSSASW